MKRPTAYITISTMLFLSACTAKQQTNQNWAQDTTTQQAAFTNAADVANLASTTNATPASTDLVDILVGRLGINAEQAQGGVGSVFALAQQRMRPEDFMQLSSSVPGVDQYLAAVPAPSSSNVLWGSAANMLGRERSGLGNLVGLVGSFQSLGMNSSVISEFVPVVLQYVQGQSGPAAMSLLQNALY